MSDACDDLLDTASRLSARLGAGVLVFDGAMGTELLARRPGVAGLPAALTVTDSELVASVHRDYLAAGADVIGTNTFGANRVTLAGHGAELSVERLNRDAVALARRELELAGGSALLGGTIAPAAGPHAAARDATAGRDALIEQAECLADAGVDLIVFETFSALDELVPVLEVLALEVPLLASFTFSADGSTFAGDALAQVAADTTALGVAALGANCLLGPTDLRPVAAALVRASALPIFVQPVGIPRSDEAVPGGRSAAAQAWARGAWALVSRGAAMVGGCCGTTPAHIAALVAERSRAGG